MPTPTLKPGTRCECRDPKCPCEDASGLYHDECVGREQCPRPAVRLVTVRPLADVAEHYRKTGWPNNWDSPVPMCAVCAEYHERGAN